MAQGFGAQEVEARASTASAGAAQREPSMEEILASIRRIIEDGDVDGKESEKAISTDETADVSDVDDGMRNNAQWQRDTEDVELAQANTDETVPDISSAAEAELKPAVREEQGARAILREDGKVTPLKPPEAASSLSPHRQDEPMPGILSEQTGRKVAAAFAELNEAFEVNRRKSFDEAAEEMLRPMLREWLDDNLPGMVEKLVREEIERLARG